VTLTHREVFERYVYAGAVNRDAEAMAALFTHDGIYEAPLVPPGHRLPHRLVGPDDLSAGFAVYHREPPPPGRVNADHTRYVLHDTDDADVFIAELDAVIDGPSGERTTVSLVQIFRLRDGRIAHLRDYFAAPPDPPAAHP
jgi:ketosteroid isomerase-like protein